MPFQPGDVVEVIKSLDVLEDEWVGRQLVVTNTIESQGQYFQIRTGEVYRGALIQTTPRILVFGMFIHAWRPDQLKKINPPDWRAEDVSVCEQRENEEASCT